MSADIQELIKRYQAGEEVRGFIELELQETAGQDKEIKGYDTGGQVFNKSLNYALKNYNASRNKDFKKYFNMVYYGRLINEKEKKPIVTIRNIKAFEEARKNILGSPFDNKIIKESTRIFDDEILNKLRPIEKDYLALYLNFAVRSMELTDDVAGEVMKRTRQSVINWRKKTRKILLEHGKNNMQNKHKISENENELPSLVNEYGNIDPTPREAVKRIIYKES